MVARKQIERERVPIPTHELAFHPHSFADDAGRLFSWNERLWRGINYTHAPFFDKLFGEGIVDHLVKRKLLIESEPTDLAVDGYAMVIGHRSVPFVSYPHEWCAAMLKDAALTILDLAIELAKQDLVLRDAHPWNVLVDWSGPVFVDLTSIALAGHQSVWPAYDEFCRFCYYPLILMSQGQERIARSLLPEYEGVLRSEVLALLRGSGPSRFLVSKALQRPFNSMRSVFGKNLNRQAPAFLRRARRALEGLPLPSYRERHRRRRIESMASTSTEAEWTARPLTLRKILNELKPETILDLSRGPTWTSTVPAIMGFKVVSIDPDPARISVLYETSRRKNLSILPFIVDFLKPTPSVGYSNHYSIAATERLRCDMVLALGLTRIALENHLTLDLIVEGLASFTKRWLVVGFGEEKTEQSKLEVSPPQAGKDSCVPGSIPGSPGVEDFIGALRRRFSEVSVVSSSSQSGVWLLCKK